MSFTVRPSNSEKDVFRVKLTAATLLSLKVKPGDVVQLQSTNDEQRPPRPAIAWENSGNGMKDTIVQTSKFLQEFYGFRLGDRITITRSTYVLKDAEVINIRPVSNTVTSEEYSAWQWALSAIIPTKHDVLAPGQILLVEIGNKRGEFEVEDVGGILGRVTAVTRFVFKGQGIPNATTLSDVFELKFDGIGGLQHEIAEVRKQIKFLIDSQQIRKHWSGYPAQHGLLLYGSKGTGKSLFQNVLSRNSWNSVVRWAPGTKLPTSAFPQLILADVSELIGSHRGITELLAVFRDVRETPTLIVGEVRHPNDLNERLRGEEAFSTELELPIPDSDKRLDILRALRRESSQPSDEQIAELAARTHGFVGADLAALLREIWNSAFLRATETPAEEVNGINHLKIHEESNEDVVSQQASNHDNHKDHPPDTSTPPIEITITSSDIDQSLSSVRPSALQQVFLEKPNVRWTDIGGQHTLKHRLTTAVNRTLSPNLRARMTKLGLEVTKGVLLYGPPGCSKTLLAKALATEAELNFLAVKGAELISMYVGESERATREVFRKARAAAPSILFFDEIDAIASRDSSSATSGSSNLNVLTTLLNEMDGFEELRNVIVIAATNKPQSIDPALLRPGRFDNIVYVGLPDVDTRREILENRFRHVDVAEDARARFSEFAQRTEGYSGAEVVAICKAAGEAAFEADRDMVESADLEKAVETAPKGVTRAMLAQYEQWNAARSAQA